jgi:Na+-transporting methylmalonyl-CoA/oxaloacetate decarboxylase gamma subunit
MNKPLNLSQYSRLRDALTVGDVVSVAFTIARQRWKQHGGIALQATAWIFVPVIGAVLLSFGVPLMSSRAVNVGVRTGASGIMVLLFVGWLVGGIYCLGRYLANAALISRLAFNDLVQGEETIAEARRYTQSRTWSYIGASLVVGILVFGALVVAGIALSLLIGIGVALSTGAGMTAATRWQNPVVLFFLGIGAVIAILLFLVGLTWLGSRFFFYEVPMTIERETGAVASVGRTWSLGARSNWRLMLITTLAYLITIPIQVIAQVVMMVLLIIPQVIATQNSALSGGLLAMSSVVNLVVNFGVVVVTMGFWQVVKAVVYFDLRNRSEGMGLVLREE